MSVVPAERRLRRRQRRGIEWLRTTARNRVRGELRREASFRLEQRSPATARHCNRDSLEPPHPRRPHPRPPPSRDGRGARERRARTRRVDTPSERNLAVGSPTKRPPHFIPGRRFQAPRYRRRPAEIVDVQADSAPEGVVTVAVPTARSSYGPRGVGSTCGVRLKSSVVSTYRQIYIALIAISVSNR
jgi:hypothetical protein